MGKRFTGAMNRMALRRGAVGEEKGPAVRGVERRAQARDEEKPQKKNGAIDGGSRAVTGLGAGGAAEEWHDEQHAGAERGLDRHHGGKMAQGESEPRPDITG